MLSQVALKLLFDEALYNVLQSHWPTSLDDAAHLAGLLMQVRRSCVCVCVCVFACV